MLLTLGLKRDFYTNCLSPQAYCLNALYYLISTSVHWISTFYSYLETLDLKEADCTRRNFAQMPWKRICTFLVFLEFKFSLSLWIQRGKGFLKVYNLSYFEQFLFLHIFCLITLWINIWNFANLQIFLQIIWVEPKGFPKMY